MIFALLTLLAALSVAAVTEWFSVVGIMAIYAGAPLNAALIMGLVLGGAKLVNISWLYRNWKFASWKLKAPLVYFTIALMIASSIGVYGFLTKAHLEQGASTIDNSAKVERLEQQIVREKSTIADNEKVIAQLDTTINSFLGKDKADRALAVRRAQAPQRKQLRDEIGASQKLVDGFSEEKLTLTSQVRAMQLEVGPIKYIADLFYGSGGDPVAKMESAVIIFTLLIVSTLDPLAVILLIAANHTLLRLQNEKTQEIETRRDITSGNASIASIAPSQTYNQENTPLEDSLAEASGIAPAKVTDDSVDYIRIREIALPTVDGEVPAQDDNTLPVITIDDSYTPLWQRELSIVIDAPAIEPALPVSGVIADLSIVGAPAVEAKDILRSLTVDKQVSQPWAHQPGLLAELIGNQPHFIPLKINEDTQQNKMEKSVHIAPGESSGNISTTTPEKIQTMASSGPDKIQEENIEINVDEVNNLNEAGLTAIRGKYPKALSWLKEFKGD